MIRRHLLAMTARHRRTDRVLPTPAALGLALPIVVTTTQRQAATIVQRLISRCLSNHRRLWLRSTSNRRSPCRLRLWVKIGPRRRAIPKTAQIRFLPPYPAMKIPRRKQPMCNGKLSSLHPQSRYRRNPKSGLHSSQLTMRFRSIFFDVWSRDLMVHYSAK